MNAFHATIIVISILFLLIGCLLMGISIGNTMKKWNNVIHGDTCYLLGLASLFVGFILFYIGICL